MSARHTEKNVKKGPRCPICSEKTDTGYRPFCSKRCADIDLGRWLNGAYAIGGHEDDDEDGIPAIGLAPLPDNDPNDT